MLRKNEIILDINEEIYNIYNWGSILQGVIMENIPEEFAQILHEMKSNTYSQYIIKREDKYIWVISTFDEETYKNIIENFIFKIDEINIKHKNKKVKITEKKEVVAIELEDLFKKWFFNKNINNRINLTLLTPLSYKSNNTYQIFPKIEFILPNLINKWNNLNIKNQINQEILDEYINRTFIEKYRLQSVKFGLEGMNINSFIGKLTLKIKANETMINLLNMLFEFGEYTGIGIKTSMGMGGIKFEK